MDFHYTSEEESFRQEAAAWLDATIPHLPADPGTDQSAREDAARWWQTKLFEGGWTGISWPVAYGGRGLTVAHEAIFNAEAALRGAPRPINFLAMTLAGPTILVHGTEDQKLRFLPKILSGEEIWCQGFSEPEAGSDLAGVRTRAQEQDGRWIVNGEKVWTSFAHLADRCMLLARTDGMASKHAGLTYFCAPMADVDVVPLTMSNGDADFNEMRFEDVCVPHGDVLGGTGDGWKVALTTLSFERGILSLLFWVEAQQTLDRLVGLVRNRDGQAPSGTTEQLGRFRADVEGLRIGVVRLLSGLDGTSQPGPEGSILKLVWAAVMQDMMRCAVELQGWSGVGLFAPDPARWSHAYLRGRGNSIEGGTDEIQRSIVAERMLGLPRSR